MDGAEIVYNCGMDRVIRFDSDDLEGAPALAPEERLRQANAAFRLYHALHHPYANPFFKGFDTLEEFARFREDRLRR